MLTEVVEGDGSAFRAGTVAIPSSSASLWQVREEKGCITMWSLTGWTGVTLSFRDWYHLRIYVVSQFWTRRTTREAETFVPNLDWSFDAPTTAKLGEDRNFFLISCVMTISIEGQGVD